MKSASDGKIDSNGIISSNDLITEKEGYEAMLYMLYAYYAATGSMDLTDILSGGEYWHETGKPTDTAYWEYWLEAVQKVKNEGPPPLKEVVIVNQTDALKEPDRLIGIIRIAGIILFFITLGLIIYASIVNN